MSTTVSLRDIVGIGENIFLVGIIPLQSNFYTDAIFRTIFPEVKDLVDRGTCLIGLVIAPILGQEMAEANTPVIEDEVIEVGLEIESPAQDEKVLVLGGLQE